MLAYYGGSPGVNMSGPAPAPPAADPVAAYYGPPPPPAPPAPPVAAEPPMPPAFPPPPPPAPRDPQSFTRHHVSGVPTGPTERDNREFDIYKAKLEAQPKPAPRPAGGAGAPSGLQKNVDAANKHLLGTYDDERALLERGGQARAAAHVMQADRHAEISRMQEEDAAIAHLEEQQAQEGFAAQMKEAQDQLAQVREQKIDPLKSFKGQGADFAFAAILSAVGAGIYQGLKGGENMFLKELNDIIDRSMLAQEKNIKNQKDAALDKVNLLQQQRAIFKDHQVAELQFRNMHYEAAKTQLLSDAARSDVDLEKIEAEQKAKLLEREQAALQKAIAERALAAQQAAAAAAAAQQRAMRKEAIDNQFRLMEIGIKQTEAEAKLAEHGGKDAQRFIATGRGEDGNPVGYLGRNPETAAKEEDGRKARAELLSEIDSALALREETGTLGRTLNREGALKLWTPEWQEKVRSKGSRIMLKANKAAGAGTIDSGTIPMLEKLVGELDTAGSGADVRLRELRDQIDRENAADARTVAGQQVQKVIGPDGREHIVPLGGQNAPHNPRTIAREPVGR